MLVTKLLAFASRLGLLPPRLRFPTGGFIRRTQAVYQCGPLVEGVTNGCYFSDRTLWFFDCNWNLTRLQRTKKQTLHIFCRARKSLVPTQIPESERVTQLSQVQSRWEASDSLLKVERWSPRGQNIAFCIFQFTSVTANGKTTMTESNLLRELGQVVTVHGCQRLKLKPEATFEAA